MSDLAEVIKYHRKKSGLSQKELADLAGVGKTVIFDMENGKDTVLWSTIKKVMAALNIKIKFDSKLMSQIDFYDEKV